MPATKLLRSMRCKRLAAILCAVLLLGTAALASEGTVRVSRTINAVSGTGSLSAESELGSVTADAVRIAAGTELAVLSGGDFSSDLIAAEYGLEELRGLFVQDYKLAVTELTPAKLYEYLEAGVRRVVLDENEKIDHEASAYAGFPQISGFSFIYDMSAPPGERVYSVTLDSGETLACTDDQTLLTVASTSYLLGGGYDMPAVDSMETLGATLSTALLRYLSSGAAEQRFDGRISAIGSADNSIISKLSTPVLWTAIVFLGVTGILFRLTKRKETEQYNTYILMKGNEENEDNLY